MDLLERIEKLEARVAVAGLGYVGLRMAIRAASVGFHVAGVDIDERKVAALARGESYIDDVPAGEVRAQIASGKFEPTGDVAAYRDSDIILIAAQTPLKGDHPDMSYVERAGRDIGKGLKKGKLVVLESTTYPGTTEEFLREILESSSGLQAGRDFSLGFSPERINPGDPVFGVENVPKIIAGIDENSTELMRAFYERLVDRVVVVSSPKSAEMAKLLENTFRHVNIALINEIAILCHDLGIDVWEVIDAAATKPFGFYPFYPGPGVGGHCIPIDPSYLSWRVRQMGETARFVELAREINLRMPPYIVQRIEECLALDSKLVKGSSVLILGVAYKPDVADVRESPALEIASLLKSAGADVSFHDPHVEEVIVDGGKVRRVDLDEKALEGSDLVVVSTAHSSYEWDWIARHAGLIFDTRNAMAGISGRIIRL